MSSVKLALRQPLSQCKQCRPRHCPFQHRRGIKQRFQRPHAVRVCAVSGWAARPSDQSMPLEGATSNVLQKLYAFYKFSRPHTMAGTTVSIASMSLLALQGSAITAKAWQAFGIALSSALLANISIVGLNQVFDVNIDKVNKPYLPLASGEMSLRTGIITVIATAIGACAIAVLFGSAPLVATVVISLILGVLYSTDLPFLRWKQYPVLAAGCILCVRAVLVQLGFYLHMRGVVDSSAVVLPSPAVLFVACFMVVFSIVIALFKDIPDVKGDAQAGVRTFSVRHGTRNVFWTCISLLTAAYAGATAFAICTQGRMIGIAGHLAMMGMLWSRALSTNVNSKQELVDYYMFIWKLFYAEYLLIPFF